jgi:hypothetical protein
MTPFAPDETVETPPLNVIAVAALKAVAVPELFVTVGSNNPIEFAPPKVKLCEPV